MELTIPFGCRARVYTPAGCKEKAGYPITLECGEYKLKFDVLPGTENTWSLESDWREALDNPKVRTVVEKYFPKAIKGIAFQKEMYTLGEVTRSPFAQLTEESIAALDAELRRIKY